MISRHPTMARRFSETRNFHCWVFNLFKNYLIPGGVTIEIGAGHSGYSRFLANMSSRLIVSDIDRAVIEKLKSENFTDRNIEFIVMDGLDSRIFSNTIDNIVALNVLEHMNDDNFFLQNCYQVLKKNGRVIILAPAFRFLFSKIDKEAGHFRRYSKIELKNLLERYGFRILHISYFNVIGFFGWLINKYIASGVDSKATNFQILLYDRLLWLAKPFEIFSSFIGLSILIVGEKQ